MVVIVSLTWGGSEGGGAGLTSSMALSGSPAAAAAAAVSGSGSPLASDAVGVIAALMPTAFPLHVRHCHEGAGGHRSLILVCYKWLHKQ